MSAYAGLIQGKDVAVDCDTENRCSVDIQDFPLKLTLPCSFGDCQSASHPALFGRILPVDLILSCLSRVSNYTSERLYPENSMRFC